MKTSTICLYLAAPVTAAVAIICPQAMTAYILITWAAYQSNNNQPNQ